jgi:hypothetical protein
MFPSPQRWFTGITMSGIVFTLASLGPTYAADGKCTAKEKGICQDGEICAAKCKAKGAGDNCNAPKADGMGAHKGLCMAKGKGKCMNKAIGAGKDMGMCKDMCMDGGMGMCKGMGMGGGKRMGMMGMNQSTGMCGMGMCGMGGRPMNMQQSQQQQAQNVAFQNQLRRLAKQSKTNLQEAFKNDEPEVRAAAAWLAGDRRLTLQGDLIGLLTDPSELVRQSSRRSLVLLSMPAKSPSRAPRTTQTRGIDFGPLPGAGEDAQTTAAQQWQQWWDSKR